MDKISRPYQDELLKALKDPSESAEYLNAALAEGSGELFLLALRNVAKARGIESLSDEVQSHVDRLLFGESRSQLSNLSALLRKMGLKLSEF